MSAGLRMDLLDREATPEVRMVRAANVPPGRWQRHWHFPRPVTPLYADFEFGSHLVLSEIVGAEEFAAIRAARPEMRRPPRHFVIVDGFVYRGEPAPTGAALPEGSVAAPVQSGPATDRAEEGYEWTVVRRWREVTRADVLAALRRFRSTDLPRLSDAELREHIRALSRHLVEGWALYFTIDAAADVVRHRCQVFCVEQLAVGEAEFLQLFAGSSPATTEPVIAMENVAGMVLATPDLRAALDGPAPWEQPGIRALLAPYLDAFGHRASDWEYIDATLAERPDRAVHLLREAVARVEAGQESTAVTVAQRRDDHVAAMRQRLPNPAMRAIFDRLLKDAQETFAIHEENINLYLLGAGYMRYALLEAGARLGRRGLLATPERVFFLRRRELESALLDQPAPDLSARADARWSDYQRQAHLDPPRTLEVSVDAPVAHQPVQPETGPAETTLRGLGASAGVYAGRVRVIVREEQFDEVETVEVLVCPQTSPSWTILFGRIGALVTDDGGILSHSAIAAREVGLPAVLATRTGTRALATGQFVRVDGAAGSVQIVRREG